MKKWNDSGPTWEQRYEQERKRKMRLFDKPNYHLTLEDLEELMEEWERDNPKY